VTLRPILTLSLLMGLIGPNLASAQGELKTWLDACFSESLRQRVLVAEDPHHAYSKINMAEDRCVSVQVTICRFSPDPVTCSAELADHVLDYVSQQVHAMPDTIVAQGKAKENYTKRLGGMRRNLLFADRIATNPSLSEDRRAEAFAWWEGTVARGRHPWLGPELSERLLNAELASQHLQMLRSDLERYPL